MKFEEVERRIKDVEGWLTEGEAEFLYSAAKNASGKGDIVEIGSYKGKSTICLAGGSEEGAKKKVFAIDPHLTDVEQKIFNKDESSYADFVRNIENAGFTHAVTAIVKKSDDVAREWHEPVALLWIDGDHSYAGATLDFDVWFPFLVPGGIVAFHDSTYPEVDRVVRDRLFSSRYIKSSGIVGTIAYGIKTAEPISFSQALHNRWVVFLQRAHAILRGVPLPSSLRKSAKKIGRAVLRNAQ